MPVKKNIIIGCSVLLGLSLLAVVAIIVGIAYLGQDPKGVAIRVETAIDVQKDAEFELVVNVTNNRPSKPFKLSSIDISEDYLKGFILVSSEPQAKSSQHIPLDNSRSFAFDDSIAPRDARVYKFKLRAREDGFFKGDVDVCEGARFITSLAQTEVK